jgi:hypothetical protein
LRALVGTANPLRHPDSPSIRERIINEMSITTSLENISRAKHRWRECKRRDREPCKRQDTSTSTLMFLSVKIPMEVTDCSTTIKDSDANDFCLDEWNRLIGNKPDDDSDNTNFGHDHVRSRGGGRRCARHVGSMSSPTQIFMYSTTCPESWTTLSLGLSFTWSVRVSRLFVLTSTLACV